MQNLVITKKGKELMLKIIAGTSTVTFTKICTSDFDYLMSDVETLTTLQQIKQQTLVSKVEKTDLETVEVIGSIDNKDVTSGYYVKAIGLYAKDNTTQEEVLYGVSIETQNPDYMPAFGGKTVSGITFKFGTRVDNSENVTIEVNPAAIPTITQLKNLENKVSSNFNSLNSTKADKTTVYTKHETDTKLSEKTGINATATHSNNTVSITAPVVAQQITFIAPSDFSDSNTYTLNGNTIVITDLNNEPLSNAWKQGSPVQLTIKGNQGFFKFGGGDSKLNIFVQPTQPPINEGIWLQTNDKFKNVQVANDVVQSGDWSLGSEFGKMPIPLAFFVSLRIENEIYFFGGETEDNKVSDKTYVYNLDTKVWRAEVPMLVGLKYHTGEVVRRDGKYRVFVFGGYTQEGWGEYLYEYDIYEKKWYQKSKLPIKFVSSCAANYGDQGFFVFGGQTEAVSSVYQYSIFADYWSLRGGMPVPRFGARCMYWGAARYYITGGLFNGEYLNSTYEFITAGNAWTQKPDKPHHAAYFASDYLQDRENDEDKFYCMGGFYRTPGESKTSHSIDVIDVFDFKQDKWVSEGKLPTPKAAFDLKIFEDKFYTFGGRISPGEMGGLIDSISNIEVFNRQLNEWSLNADLRQAKYGHCSVEFEGKIYTIGGYNGNSRLNTVEIYDVKTNQWTTGTPMPTARDSLWCVVVDTKIFAIGGWNGSRLNTVEIYDVKTNQWTTGTPMPTARSGFGSVVCNQGKIYCIGGFCGGYFSTVEIYDIATDTWITGKDMPTARYSFGCVAVNDKIYCIGGYGGANYLNTVEIYDVKTNQWTTGTPMPTSKGHFACIVVGTKIYCISGWDRLHSTTNTAEIYDIVTNQWTTGKPMPTPRGEFGCVVVGTKIYCLGGRDANQTEIMTLLPTPFPENTLVLQTPVGGKTTNQTKYTQIAMAKNLVGTRLLTGFLNAWIYKNEQLKEYPAYYGDGKKWVKFKN